MSASTSTRAPRSGRITPTSRSGRYRGERRHHHQYRRRPVDTVVTVSGAPTTPEPPAEHGFTLERSFHALRRRATPTSAQAKQNDRLVVVLKVTEPQPQFARVALIDYLPAGFEIDNPHLVSSGDTGSFAWLGELPARRCIPSSATTASPRPSTAQAAILPSSRRLCGARGLARRLHAAAGTD